ncbi:MAG TPA: SusC/RagA family TonB-linked outer membrane protein [Bacteroidales bacterium]|jgi:TonB-linked SusC/RagA family outer membrane protein|nr:SusC/RagA family TonB-linked outer membrane protein [Bacteroidales bacterium]HQJ82064.1 SusC/RagA family TonB-linked outer membrane protein [Bacteroidales bacterium]
MRKFTLFIAAFFFIGLQSVFAQKLVSGTVKSAEDGLGIIGATVVVPGTTIGTTTDASGAFTLNVPTDAQSLSFSYVGMKTVELSIGTQTVFNVTLEPDVMALQDVIVTAFGISRQTKSLTYAAQSVTTDALTEARNPNVMSGLSGKVSGMLITQTGQGVGGSTKVLLRGNRSISGSSQPIYVVDGITLNGGIENISPDEIESISVLKGANAAALYGSRANNGAIVVTTKSGKGARQGVTTSLGFTYQANQAMILQKVQNIYGQGANGMYAKAATVAWGPKMEGQMVDHWSNDPSYYMYGKQYPFLPQPNNIKDFFRIGNSFSTNLGVNINSDVSNITFSYTNSNDGGIIDGNDLKGHNLNLRVRANLSRKLTLDSKLNVIKRNYSNVFITGETFENPMRYLYMLPRNIRSEDIQHYEFINPAGQLRQHYWKVNDNGSGNPYWSVYNAVQPSKSQRAIAMMSLKYEFLPGLSIQGRSGFDGTYTNTEWKRNNDTYTNAYYGAFSKTSSNSYEWNNDFLINYNKNFGEFALDLNAGGNHRLYESENVSGSGSIFNIENMFALANTKDPRPGEGYSKKVVQSFYGFGELSWRNALFLNITGRNDWSSTLPAASRSYFYPSVGLTAVLSDLMTLPAAFTHFKLRTSYAEVGNDAGAYNLHRSASVSLGTIGLSTSLPNPNLKPERTRSIEAGLDLRMFNDRGRLSGTWYQTNTYDQLFSTPVPVTSGVSSVYQNGADVQNRGVELTLGAVVVDKRDFSWDIMLNWSKNVSKILEIAEGFDVLSFGTDFIREYKLVKGEAFGDVYAKGFQRDANGNVIINQANGLPLITSGMTVKVANYNPDWLGGLSNTITYKNLSLNALIDARWGGSFISFTEAITAGNGILDYTAIGREDGSLLFGRDIFKNEKGVTPEGGANTKATNAEAFWNNVGGRNNPAGEAFVRDATNIRLREVILGYNLPKDLVAKTFFSAARVSLVGRNLFFFMNKAEHSDPEIVNSTANTDEGREAFALPTTRTFGVSLNFDF